MVEKSHIAGGLDPDWWPSIYAPLGRLGQESADWLAPRADAAATEDCYEINVEFRGCPLITLMSPWTRTC